MKKRHNAVNDKLTNPPRTRFPGKRNTVTIQMNGSGLVNFIREFALKHKLPILKRKWFND